MALNYVTLTVDLGAGQGFYLTSGMAAFVPTAVLTDAADHLMVSQVPLSVTFSEEGSPPKIRLLATDNANLAPSGWAWTITPPAGSGIAPFSFFLPFSGGASQYLSALAPVSSVVTMQAYMPLPAGTAQAGQAPLATGSGSASAWGNVATNPMTTSGDTVYGGASGALTRLAGDTSNTRKFLRDQSSGGVAQPPAWDTIAAGDVPTLNQNTTGTAANVTGTVAIANGGTGQATQQAAIDALAGSQTSAQYLRGNGTHVQMSAIQAGDVPTLNQNTTGTAAGLSATLAIGSGGTGQVTAAAAFSALAPLTTLGDLLYENSTPAPARLAGNTSATKNFLTQTGTGSVSAAPAWGTIAAADLPTGTTSTKGALQLDGTAADLVASGAAAAGATGKAADAAHAHPDNGFTPADLGLLAWTYDIGVSASGSAPASGVVNLIRVNIRQAISVTNVVLAVTTAGSGLTSGQNFAGLYNSAGTLIGTSADQSASWASSGLKTIALTGGPFALSAGTFVWVAIVSNGTTPPTLFRTGVLAAAPVNAGFAASTARYATNGTATTALAGSITPGSNVLAGTAYWAALS